MYNCHMLQAIMLRYVILCYNLVRTLIFKKTIAQTFLISYFLQRLEENFSFFIFTILAILHMIHC